MRGRPLMRWVSVTAYSGFSKVMRWERRSKSASSTSNLSPRANTVAAMPASKNFIVWPLAHKSAIKAASCVASASVKLETSARKRFT